MEDVIVSPVSKIRFSLSWLRWWKFIIVWLILGTICWWAYERKFSDVARVFPELGMCQQTQYGNTVLKSEVWPGYIRVMFSPTPAGSRLGGGVIWGNIFSANGITSDFPIDEGSAVHLRVRGKYGGEKFELKLMNSRGEGWCIIGSAKYPIKTQFQEFEIPLEEFERADRSSMGVAFNHMDGLKAIILGAGSDLNNANMSEIHVASLHITNRVRRDWIACVLLFIAMFLVMAIIRFVHIWRMHFTIFISYSSRDKKVAMELYNEFERRGIFAWLAPNNLQPGDNFPMQIAIGIRLCRYFLLLASRNSSKSRFVGIEIGMRIGKLRWFLFGLDSIFQIGSLNKRNIIVVELEEDKNSVPSDPREPREPIVPVVFKAVEKICLGGQVTCATAAEEIASVIHWGRSWKLKRPHK